MTALDFEPSAPRKATYVSINSDLLRVARRLGVNLSRELEKRLEEIVAAAQSKRWLEENKAAIEAYNDHVERRGVFSEGLRTF